MEDSGAFSVTTSSLAMEVVAVTRAMAWLDTHRPTLTNVCFLSDSMSMLRRIQNGWFRRQWLESLARSKMTKIGFIFVPGHAGVMGNERADCLAGKAIMESGRSMDRSDILHDIKEAGRENDSSKDIDARSQNQYDSFIRNTLGKYLPPCLSLVAELRPANPIEFIAQHLYHIYDSQMYFKAKIQYMAELCTTYSDIQRERRNHQAKIKPFVEAMHIERLNYYNSLREELDTIRLYLGNIDQPVDESAKKRFLEVQGLIQEEEVYMAKEAEQYVLNRTNDARARFSERAPDGKHKLKSKPSKVHKQGASQNTLGSEHTVEAKFKLSASLSKSELPLIKPSKTPRPSIQQATSEASLIPSDTPRNSTTRKSISENRPARMRTLSSRRLIRDSRSPVRLQVRSLSVVIGSKAFTRSSTSSRKYYPRGLDYQQEEDSDDSVLSSRSKDNCDCRSLTRQQMRRKKLKDKRAARRHGTISPRYKFSSSSHVSESASCESLSPIESWSTDSLEDSDIEPTVESNMDRPDKRDPSKQHSIRMDAYCRHHRSSKKHKTTSVPQSLPQDEGTAKVTKDDDDDGKASRKGGQRASEGSSSWTAESSCGVVAFVPSSGVVTPGQRNGGALSENQEHEPVGKPVWVKRKMKPPRLSPAVEDGVHYHGDVDEMSGSVQEQTTSDGYERKGSSERLHLPPIRTEPRGLVACTHGASITSGPGEHQIGSSPTSDQSIRFPTIASSSRTSGTLIMTNVGHIAYISDDFGVVAPNSLKIRNVNPLDKPEMWGQRQFQCQSFYDHELYSQNGIVSLDSGEEDNTHEDLPRMTFADNVDPTRGRWNWTKGKRPP